MSVNSSAQIVCLDPTVQSKPKPFALAPAVSLAGKRIGFIDRSTASSGRFVVHMTELLTEKYGIVGTMSYRKLAPSKPLPPDLMDEMAEGCDAVIVGVGD